MDKQCSGTGARPVRSYRDRGGRIRWPGRRRQHSGHTHTHAYRIVFAHSCHLINAFGYARHDRAVHVNADPHYRRGATRYADPHYRRGATRYADGNADRDGSKHAHNADERASKHKHAAHNADERASKHKHADDNANKCASKLKHPYRRAITDSSEYVYRRAITDSSEYVHQ